MSKSILDILLGTILSLEEHEQSTDHSQSKKDYRDGEVRKAHRTLNYKLRRYVPRPPRKPCTRCPGSGEDPD